jgi:hypothetical protein
LSATIGYANAKATTMTTLVSASCFSIRFPLQKEKPLEKSGFQKSMLD